MSALMVVGTNAREIAAVVVVANQCNYIIAVAIHVNINVIILSFLIMIRVRLSECAQRILFKNIIKI